MNHLFYGDNLDVLRYDPYFRNDETVDLIYLDPPFNSRATYNVTFREPGGEHSESQVEAFVDTWGWGPEAEAAVTGVVNSGNTDAADLLIAIRKSLGDTDLMAYLAMMAVRLLELRRVLKPTGSIYLHCDPTASHHLKLLLDGIFGPTCFRAEIIWKRSSAHSDGKQGRKQYGRIHDVIFFYTKSDNWAWNPVYTPYDQSYIDGFYRHLEPGTGRRYRLDNLTGPGGAEKGNPRYEVLGITRYWRFSKKKMAKLIADGRVVQSAPGAVPAYKRYLDEMPGTPLQDVWTDLPPIGARATERLGYPTQKPLSLLERIITVSSNPGDIVFDPFCGCGTTVHAAQKLGRPWIGIDITHLAISLIEHRLKRAFPGIAFEVHGTPKDMAGARDLAARNKDQFQKWAVSLIDAQPYQTKKGADGGIDGLIYYAPDGRNRRRALVSVKGGRNVGADMVRDLKGTMQREKAEFGIFLTLAPPTRPMVAEAASAGEVTINARQYPALQIITVAEALTGVRPNMPMIDTAAAFRNAKREAAPQPKLDI